MRRREIERATLNEFLSANRPLVELRCGACARRRNRTVVALIMEVPGPDEWAEDLRITPCPTHAGYRSPAGMRAAAARGVELSVSVAWKLPVEALRPAIDEALRTSRTRVETIRAQ